MPGLRVATLNCRNTADRWPERRTLLSEQLVRLSPDVLALQEVRRFPRQAFAVANDWQQRSGQDLFVRVASKQRHLWWWEGVATVSRRPVLEHERFRLPGGVRVAQRTRIQVDGSAVDVYNTHLHHRTADGLRPRQVRVLLRWIQARSAGVPHILMGDFNARPATEEIGLLKQHLRSAHEVVHGGEPERTFPAPLNSDFPNNPRVYDYILVSAEFDVEAAAIAFAATAPNDNRLSASDHYGVTATLSLRLTPGS